MGRLALPAAWGGPGLDFVHINETNGGAATAAHLLSFDSVHGRYPRLIEAQDKAISIDGRSITFSEHAAPGEVPWEDLGVDLALESNCLAPVVKVVHEGIGIRHGVITTIHDITSTQTVVDARDQDLRRARASSLSLIPRAPDRRRRSRSSIPS